MPPNGSAVYAADPNQSDASAATLIDLDPSGLPRLHSLETRAVSFSGLLGVPQVYLWFARNIWVACDNISPSQRSPL